MHSSCLSVNALYALRPRSHVALRGELCEGVRGEVSVCLSGNGVYGIPSDHCCLCVCETLLDSSHMPLWALK